MNLCPMQHQAGAYHDGELSGAEAAAFEAHLAGCAACAAELESSRLLSSLLPRSGLRRMPSAALARVHAMVDDLADRTMLRFSEALAAAAAMILVAATVWLYAAGKSTRADDRAAPAPWQSFAATLQTDVPADNSAGGQLSDWMLTNLPEGTRDAGQ